MRHQITRLMMYNTLGYVKKSRQKNLKNFNQVRQKNIWGGFPKISSWTCFLPFLRCRTRWDRLKIVSTTRYIYKRFIFQNSPSPLSGGGGGVNLTPQSRISAKLLRGARQKNFFQNWGANAFALAFRGVLELYSNEIEPKVPFLENFRRNTIFRFWGDFPPILGRWSPKLPYAPSHETR